MTKSIIRLDKGFLIELNKKGIEVILVYGEVKVGDYDGVSFTEKGVSEQKMEYVGKIVEDVKKMMGTCPHVKSIIMSDMFYVKFEYAGNEVIAFVSEGMTTFNAEVEVDKAIKEEIERCVERFKEVILKSTE